MEIVKIDLENEMDLILAHKRSMKLAELCGQSALLQTSFATAVSEICRCVITPAKQSSQLSLGIQTLRNSRKELVATLTSPIEFDTDQESALRYATRLVSTLKVTKQKRGSQVVITEKINFGGLLNEARMEAFINYFRKELPLSPYDEIRKKNIQLLEFAEKLKESEEQYRRLSETLPLMVFTANAGGYLTYGNSWLKEYFNYTDVVPGKVQWINMLDTVEHRTIYPLWEKTQVSVSPLKAQVRLKGKNKSEPIWHLVSLIPLRNDDNQLAGWTGFFVDIHAQKLVEETLKNNVELKATQKQLLASQTRLEENLKELNKSNHDLEQFAYIASHDLQEPLRKIRNFSELLERNIDNKAQSQKLLKRIDVAATRMSALIRDVLNYSRLSKAQTSFEEVDLARVFNDVKTDLELLVEEKKATIVTSPLPVITGIPLQLHQLFYNLLTNSLKFSDGAPVISVTCRELSAAEAADHPDLHASVHYVQLIFKDNGIGFEQKYARQVFVIFKRLNAKDSYEGTGIGLALCKKIVDNHHGVISVESEPGKGTTFKIILPRN